MRDNIRKINWFAFDSRFFIGANNLILQVLIVGNGAVGKSSMIQVMMMMKC